MRVLYVVSLFPCWSETFIVREITALVRRGVDVRILSLRAPRERLVQEDARALEGRVVPRPSGARSALAALRAIVRHPVAVIGLAARLAAALAFRPLELAKSWAALWRALGVAGKVKEIAPDLVHAHWATYPSTAALALHRLLGIPYGFTAHAHDLFLHDHLLREKLVSARLAVTVSEFNRGWVADRLGPQYARRLCVVHCGVPLDDFAFQPEGRQPGLILAVGRLDPIKGFDVLVEACAILRRRGHEVDCEIVGEGSERPALEARIAALGLGDRVRLSGAMPQEDVRRLLYRATVFALPCVVTREGNCDGVPVALMEAMAAGTPVVSTCVSGVPEIVEHEHTGLLARPGAADDFAGRLERALADGALRARLAVNARRAVERAFDSDREAEALLARFREAVRSAPPAGGAVEGDFVRPASAKDAAA